MREQQVRDAFKSRQVAISFLRRVFSTSRPFSINLQTRTIKKEIDLTDIIPSFGFPDSNLIVGFHDRGLFEDIRVQDSVRK